MTTIVLTPKDSTEEKLIVDLLKKMNVDTKVITEKQREDLGLIKMIKASKDTKKVSRASIMKSLGK